MVPVQSEAHTILERVVVAAVDIANGTKGPAQTLVLLVDESNKSSAIPPLHTQSRTLFAIELLSTGIGILFLSHRKASQWTVVVIQVGIVINTGSLVVAVEAVYGGGLRCPNGPSPLPPPRRVGT